MFINVLHWRGLEHTRACVQSILHLTYPNFKVLIIDNGSPQKESKTLAEGDPRLFWLGLDENKGFSGGHNAGLAYAMQNGADFVWLLNNDATVEANCLSKLIEIAESEKSVGAVNAAVLDTVLNSDLSKTPVAGRGVIDYRRGKTLLKEAASQTDFVDCDWLAASNLLLRTEAIRQVGDFDERYFLYFEDVELCHRLRLSGWRCLHVSDAHITHVGGASTEESLQHWRSYYYTRNRCLFFKTYATLPQRLSSFFFIWMHVLRHCLSLTFKGAKGTKQLRAELKGMKDFVAGRFGPAMNLD